MNKRQQNLQSPIENPHTHGLWALNLNVASSQTLTEVYIMPPRLVDRNPSPKTK